ncbi:unnamed protein product [Parnassius apollo]|uniref:Eclosion hormone n=1 Tax=Parnassius apollo TaxID=110799 RepID=A0A8S3WIG7_PARAO|nr:unnamed protein product [Parnassius apollo]
MASKSFFILALFISKIVIGSIGFVNADPSMVVGYDPMEICIENCAQCKKMLGSWFDGPLCAESCIRNRGRFMPDCEDFASIAPFLTKI